MASEIEQLLGRLLSDNNEVRKQSEDALTAMKQRDPNGTTTGLLQALGSAAQPEIRQMACSTLHTALMPLKTETTVWPLLTPDNQQLVKTGLISLLQRERDTKVLRKLCDTMSDLCAHLNDLKTPWTELLGVIFSMTSAEDVIHREYSLNIFSQLAILLPTDIFRPHFLVIKGILQKGLMDMQTLKVRLAALNATASFLQIMEQKDEASVNQFRSLLTNMLECITASLQLGQEQEAQAALEVFVELAEVEPLFFKPHLQTLISTMLTIIQAAQLTDETRRYALEVLLTLCESKPGMMKKVAGFVQTMLQIILGWMITLEDYPGWLEFEDAEEIHNSEVAEDALDRFCMAIHGKQIVPVLFGHINSLITNADWRQRHTAIMAISICGEGCQKVLKTHVPELLKNLAPLVADPSPRVRWAVVNCVGQLCTDFAPEIITSHADQLVDVLVRGMNDQVLRVKAHGATASINFSEGAEPAQLIKHLPNILANLHTLLQCPSLNVQEVAITAISSLADHADSAFLPYYDQFVPYLKNVIAKATDKQYRLLRGKAMECLSLIGVAVGKQKFSADATEVLSVMMNTQIPDADDPQISYLETAFGRIAECLEEDFVPFLPVVMPSAMARASMKAEVQVWDEGTTKKEGWDAIPIGDKSVGIHTSQLEEKASAMQILLCYAASLKGGFASFVQPVAQIAVTELVCYYHEGVRHAAYAIMPFLLASVRDAMKKSNNTDPTFLKQLWQYIFNDGFNKAIPEEPDSGVKHNAMQALEECLASFEGPCLDAEQLRGVMETFKTLLNEWINEKIKREDAKKGADFDEEDGDNLNEEDEDEDNLLGAIVDVIGAVLKTHHEAAIPAWTEFILPLANNMIQPQQHVQIRQKGICLWDDLVENCGVHSAALVLQHGIPAMLKYATDPAGVVRQAAVYGLGAAAMSLGTHFLPCLPQAYAALKQVILTPIPARNDDDEDEDDSPFFAKDNAVSAIGKILEFLPTNINVPETYQLFLSGMPIEYDRPEGAIVYKRLFDLLEKWPSTVTLGDGMVHAPKLALILATIIADEVVPSNTEAKLATLLRQLATQIPANIWASLPAEKAAALQKFVSSH